MNKKLIMTVLFIHITYYYILLINKLQYFYINLRYKWQLNNKLLIGWKLDKE